MRITNRLIPDPPRPSGAGGIFPDLAYGNRKKRTPQHFGAKNMYVKTIQHNSFPQMLAAIH